MAFAGKTRAVVLKMKSDLDIAVHIINILVSLFFIVYYGYSTYSNINNTIFLVINSIFLFLGIFGFIVYLMTYKKITKTTKVIKKIIGKMKYITKVVALVFNTIQLVKIGGSDLSLVLLIISAITIVGQLIIEIVIAYIKKYFDLLMLSVHQDFQFIFELGKIKEAKGNFFELLDAPLEAIANKLSPKKEEKVLTKNEKALEEIVGQYGEQIEKMDQEKKEAKKKEIKERSEERAKLQKEEMKEHWNIIKSKMFKKKEKVK